MTAHHLLSVEDGIAVVTLNRPEALNSLNRALRMELMELFPALDVRKDVKVIVITGAGDKAFCTGADLKERSAKTTEELVFERHYLTSKSNGLLAGISKPVIAAIKGYCMAGGYEMVLQCDIAIASDNAIFSLPEVSHGFFPGGGACQRLPRLVGYQMAKELILTGRRWDAKEAKELGLINKIVPIDKVMDEAMAMARKIAVASLDRSAAGEARAQPVDGNGPVGGAALRSRSLGRLHALGRVEGEARRVRAQGEKIVGITLLLQGNHPHPEHHLVADVDVVLAHESQLSVVAYAED